jgi:hypothetical protein
MSEMIGNVILGLLLVGATLGTIWLTYLVIQGFRKRK